MDSANINDVSLNIQEGDLSILDSYTKSSLTTVSKLGAALNVNEGIEAVGLGKIVTVDNAIKFMSAYGTFILLKNIKANWQQALLIGGGVVLLSNIYKSVKGTTTTPSTKI